MSRVIQVAEKILKETKHLGSFLWHSSKSSTYIKFKDYRMGSIRLSDHKSFKYNNKYTLDIRITDKSSMDLCIANVLTFVKQRAGTIENLETTLYTVKNYATNSVFMTNSYEAYSHFVKTHRKYFGKGLLPDLLMVDDIDLSSKFTVKGTNASM